MEGRLEDQMEGRLEDRRAVHSEDLMEGPLEGHSEDQRAVHSEDQMEGQMEGHWAGLMGGQSVPEIPRTETVLLPVLVRGPQCRQKHRPTCCRVAIALPHLEIFLQMSFLSPRWHPFHPHGAA